MNKSIKINVFGRLMMVTQSDNGWTVFYLSEDGKRRRAHDIVIPSFITESEIEGYLADLCHEWASDRYPKVRRIS